MIELVPLTESQLKMAEWEFCKVLPESEHMENVAGQLHREVSEGFINSVGIKANGRLCYTIFYHVTPARILYVNGLQRMRPDAKFDNALAGLELLAKHQKCEFIAGNARRSGLVKMLRGKGWKCTGVSMMCAVGKKDNHQQGRHD